MKLRFDKFINSSKKMVDKLLFPDDIKCTFCGRDVPDFYNKPYCDECEKKLPFNNGNKCLICDSPIHDEATVCDNCQKHKKNFVRAFCPFVYKDVIKNSILAYKNNNQRYRAKAFAIMIAKYIGDMKFDYITYIPLTKKKEKFRTFNQSKLLAEELGKILNTPVICAFDKVRDEKVSQKFLNYVERQLNITGLYVLKKVRFKKTDKVLIVDDIITTCATVGYCSGLLYPKVDKVYVCAIARTDKDRQLKQQNFSKTAQKLSLKQPKS